jgi:hypothetical protein
MTDTPTPTAPETDELSALVKDARNTARMLRGMGGGMAPVHASATIDTLCDQVATLRASEARMREALDDLLHAVCGETGFAACVRIATGKAYPWPALDLAEESARAALQGDQT